MHSGSIERHSGRGRARLGAVGVALVATALLAACQPTPDKDAFYKPPTALPTTNGAIIRSRASAFTLDPAFHTATPLTKSWQVLYKSTDARGHAMAVSGTVLVPQTPWLGGGSRPIISYGVGTRGIGDACAPSYTLANGTDYEGLFIAGLLLHGWAVAVTDYQGLGTPGDHTYAVGQSEGRAVLDMARAAEHLAGSGLSTSAPVGLMGYSQGGGAVAWAAQLAGSYAPDLKVKGTSAGGVPADLDAVAKGLDGGPTVALALLASVGFDAAYPELNLTSYLNARGQALRDRSRSLCLVSFDGPKTLLDAAFTHISDYTTTNPLTTSAWQFRLGQNKLGGTKPSAPVFLYHGLLDEIVPYGQAATLRSDWCAKGANVTWVTDPVAEHVKTLIDEADVAMEFLTARFAGLPLTGTCFLP
jgi:hypothetical protein